MGKVYYNLMRKPAAALVSVAVLALAAAVLAAVPEAPQSSLKAASLEAHEGLTISALPWTDVATYKPKFPKKNPFSFGVVGINVTFRNDSDDSVKINLDRIRLN